MIRNVFVVALVCGLAAWSPVASFAQEAPTPNAELATNSADVTPAADSDTAEPTTDPATPDTPESTAPDTTALEPSATDPAMAPTTDPSAPAVEGEGPPQVLELTAEEQEFVDKFEAQSQKLADAMFEMRAIYVRYMNNPDRTKAEVAKYREARNVVRDELNETYQRAMDVIRRIPHERAIQFVVTWIQHHSENDIYDLETYEGAARLIDGGINYRFLFDAAARSAIVSGVFDKAKLLFESIKEENLEKHDLALLYQLDQLEENWKREQEFLKADAEKELPQVKLETTRGDVVIELFIDQAPQTVSNFLQLVDQGFYDGLDFYQVIDHLLALTGDPSGNGSGNSGKYVPDEHDREDARPPMQGSLMMAKIPMGETGQFVPNSASSQFAILLLPLAGQREQTVFGRVIEGMDVIASLRRVDPSKEKKKNEVLLPPDRILKAEIIRQPEKLPEVNYVTPG